MLSSFKVSFFLSFFFFFLQSRSLFLHPTGHEFIGNGLQQFGFLSFHLESYMKYENGKATIKGRTVHSYSGMDMTLQITWPHAPDLPQSPPNLSFSFISHYLCSCPTLHSRPSLHCSPIRIIRITLCHPNSIHLTCSSRTNQVLPPPRKHHRPFQPPDISSTSKLTGLMCQSFGR